MTSTAIRVPGSTTAPPRAPAVPGAAFGLAAHERSRYRAAAGHARRVYPGALGELVQRELTAHADFGYRFGRDDLIARLAAAVLARRTPAVPS